MISMNKKNYHVTQKIGIELKKQKDAQLRELYKLNRDGYSHIWLLQKNDKEESSR